MNKRYTTVMLLMMVVSLTATAEPKRLVCESSWEGEEKRLRELANEFRDPKSAFPMLESAKKFDKYADACVNANYGGQYNFIFDTKGLNSTELSNVEVQFNGVCGAIRTDVMKGAIEATPTVISFKWVDKSTSSANNRTFNINRKTLEGGIDAERDFSCVLSDIDTSENLL